MDQTTKRNWPLDLLLTLLVTGFALDALDGIKHPTEKIGQPQVTLTAPTRPLPVEATLDELMKDPETEGAFKPVAASRDEFAVSAIDWGEHDDLRVAVHRH